MKAKDTLQMTDFTVVVETGCKNIHRIYPLKQKVVARLYEAASKYKVIRKIYVFGSSVTGKCNINSDLDICIDADVSDGMKIYHMQKELGDLCDWSCDIVMYCNMGERLKKTVQEEG